MVSNKVHVHLPKTGKPGQIVTVDGTRYMWSDDGFWAEHSTVDDADLLEATAHAAVKRRRERLYTALAWVIVIGAGVLFCVCEYLCLTYFPPGYHK